MAVDHLNQIIYFTWQIIISTHQRLPSIAKQTKTHYWLHNILKPRQSSITMMKIFVATCWPWSLSHISDLANQYQFSPKVFILLSAQKQYPSCILPLAQDRIDKDLNATPIVIMSYFHHGTRIVIYNKNHRRCWVCQI